MANEKKDFLEIIDNIMNSKIKYYNFLKTGYSHYESEQINAKIAIVKEQAIAAYFDYIVEQNHHIAILAFNNKTIFYEINGNDYRRTQFGLDENDYGFKRWPDKKRIFLDINKINEYCIQSSQIERRKGNNPKLTKEEVSLIFKKIEENAIRMHESDEKDR